MRYAPFRDGLCVLTMLAASFALGAGADAKPSKLGAGPFSFGRFADGALTLVISSDDPSVVKVSGTVSASATRGAVEWTPFDEPPIPRKKGSELELRGRIEGMSVDDYFAPNASRRLMIRNGDGRVSELDVVRTNDVLVIMTANRSPQSFVRDTRRSTSQSLDALEDGSLSLRLPKAAAGTTDRLDVVVAVRLPLADGVASSYVSAYAIDDENSLVYSGYSSAYAPGDLAFYHFSAPVGTYTVTFITTLELETSSLSSTSVTYLDAGIGPVDVSAEHRLFALSAPLHQKPDLVDAALTLEGLEPFHPSFTDRLSVGVTLASVDGTTSVSAQRDVSDGGPVLMPMRLVAGEYQVSLSVARQDGDPNGTSFRDFFQLEPMQFPADVTVSIPPLVRLTGRLVDAGFTLASSPSWSLGPTPYHSLTLADEGGGFRGTVTLRGFARGFETLVPRGSTLAVGASLTAALGQPIGELDPSRNDTGGISISRIAGDVVCDTDRSLDVEVPDLHSFVTVGGSVVDRKGRPVVFASVSASLTLAATSGGSFSTYVVTDVHGEFHLRVPRARGFQISAFASR